LAKGRKLAQQTAEVWLKKEVYGEAPQEYHFVLKNGEKLKDLKDLLKALEKMPEDMFRHHVNNARNDFSAWINDVFKDNHLAEELKKLNTKIETEIALHRNLTEKMEKLVRRLAKNE